MKIRPVGAEFHADGQTDGQTDEVNSRFSKLWDVLKIKTRIFCGVFSVLL
jgi:hypothetical protein